MDYNEDDASSVPHNLGDDESRSAVNSLILDYYKKFGRKRDLEQYFSLSTAQSDIRDPSSVFWARMKTENESSDSGDRSDNKKSESSQEICRISIRFPAQDPCTSQEEDSKTKTESVSPPIIIEELPQDSRPNSEDEVAKSDEEAMKSDDNNSQKSYDVLLDTSLNKLHSPSSSITSQRRLEWDSLADVGYANESDRKTSASSLSTLERLALIQQYSNNDTQQNSNLGVPTAHSTPLDENEAKLKSKKGVGKKSTKIYKKDVDVVEVNVPHSSNMNPAQSINVNLTKHISFNVEKDGKVTIDNIQKDISVSPEKKSADLDISPNNRMDRDVQTSLVKANIVDNVQAQQKIPIMVSLNTLRNRVRRRRLRLARRKQKIKKRENKENIPVQEKSGEQLSEAESFEYMPGHIYNQNQMTANSNNNAPGNSADNKSSLESSGVLTSDSSKGSKHSFTKDLEKSINLLKSALQKRCDDSALRKQLIQQVCQRLLNSQYRDDDSTTDFLSGLSFSSKKLGLGESNNTTSSTSDANNSAEKSKRPKKSILRADKFNAGSIASTSQSVPNLPVASKSENMVSCSLAKNLTSNTESDVSSKDKTSSDNGVAKTSAEELYKKYLQALKREEAYKKHLKDKEMFLKQKLVSSDGAFKVPMRAEVKPSQSNNRLKDLINDLTRNNYADGSGDASKLEGGPSSHSNFDRLIASGNQKSHSVFTLSSGNSDGVNKKPNLKKRLQCDMKDFSKPGPSKDSHYCCCPHHGHLKFVDSSVQVNLKKSCNDETCSPRKDILKNQCKEETCPAKQHKIINPCNEETCPTRQNILEKQSSKKLAKIIADKTTGNLEYVCLCSKNAIQEAPDDFLIYRCSRLDNKGVQLQEISTKSSSEVYVQCNDKTCPERTTQSGMNKSSQTDVFIKMLSDQTENLCSGDRQKEVIKTIKVDVPQKTTICESTRWIQTEISIDPKITEPTLSDINIVSDKYCTKLICEQCREISKSSLTNKLSTQAVASSATALSTSCKSTGSSKNLAMIDYDSLEKSKDSATSKPQANVGHIEHSEKFTIPIHGTNMTLMVSLGSEHRVNNNNKPLDTVCECIGTEKVHVTEQATSVIDECSRGVQSEKKRDPMEATDVNSNKVGNDSQNSNKSCGACQKPLTVNKSLTTKAIQCGTFPKTSPVNEHKPFRRVNTDTDKIQKVTSSKCIENKNRIVLIDNSTTISNKCSRTTSPDKISLSNINQEEICSYGCKGKKENCQLDCIESTSNQNNSPRNRVAIENKSEKCSCGCGGLRDSCKSDCINSSIASTPKDLRQHTSSSQTSSVSNKSGVQSELCSCGCGGYKTMCKKTCTSRKDTGTQPSEQTSLQTDSCVPPSKEQSSTQTNGSPTLKDMCSCGCGNNKNKCKNSCSELQSSPRNSLKNKKLFVDTQKNCNKSSTAQTKLDCSGKLPFDKEKLMQTNMSIIQNEKCRCGCSGMKNKCKKSCDELKPCSKNEKGENKSQYRKPAIDTQTNTQSNSSPKNKDQCESQFVTQLCGIVTLDKNINTQTDTYQTNSEICPCGCNGYKYNCKISCKELSSSPRTENVETNKKCGQLTSGTHVDTQTDISVYKSEKCSCGCGGTVDNCQNNCIERKSTLRKQYNNMITVAAVPEVSGSYVENCPCGCGNAKNRCKQSCVEISSPNEPKKRIDRKEVATQKNSDESPPTSSRQQRSEGPQFITRSRAQSPVSVKAYEKPLNINRDKSPPTSSRCQKSEEPKCITRSRAQSPVNPKAYEKPLKINRDESPPTSSKCQRGEKPKCITRSRAQSPVNPKAYEKPLKIVDQSKTNKAPKSASDSEPTDSGSDPIINMIQDITKKYTKNDVDKNKRRKCFKEIMTVLNYLLETDELGDRKEEKRLESSTTNEETDFCAKKIPEKVSPEKRKVDKGVQQSSKKSKSNSCATESSEVTSTDIPGTSSDSATCKVLNKIKKECERYHQKRCKIHNGKKCEASSSTSMNCDQCRRVHHCQCRAHKCKGKKCNEKISKSPVAYNLILQTSESMMSDGPSSCEKARNLRNIIVKVPKRKPPECMPFREIAAKFERQMPCGVHCGAEKEPRSCRSKSLPNECEISSMDEIIKQSQGATVREYLEKNRPDFIEKCAQRQTCMKYISESRCDDPKAPTSLKMVIIHTPSCTGSCRPYCGGVQTVPMPCMSTQCFDPCLANMETGVAKIANERAAKRDLLSMHLAQLPDVTELDSDDLRHLASELGRYMRQKQPAPKFISEREMKKHSEKIYKSLPEVVRKKEELKKENIKKTNLLMANIFKRNLQKKTLRGSVNLSNYSTVIKI